MNTQAILKFADFLEQVPEDRFQMETVVARYKGDTEETPELSSLLDTSCQTVGCVAGFCAAYFHEEFAAFMKTSVNPYQIYEKDELGNLRAHYAMAFTEQHLGLDSELCEDLMLHGWAQSPKQKAEWLRGLVNE